MCYCNPGCECVCHTKKVPHKHAALIKAWADGAKIQWRGPGGWVDWNTGYSPNLGQRLRLSHQA